MMASDVGRVSYGQANSTAAATHPRCRPTHPASPHRSRRSAAACLPSTIITAIVLGALWWLVEKIFFKTVGGGFPPAW